MELNDQQKWEAYVKGLESCNRYDRAVQKYLNWAKIEKISWDDPFHCVKTYCAARTVHTYRMKNQLMVNQPNQPAQ